MSKSMLVNVTAEEEHRVAIVDNGVLDVFEIEAFSHEHLKGNIFKTIVEGVNPALEAAFVNSGGERAGFLPLDEVNFKIFPSRGEGTSGRGRARIVRHLDKGMEVLGQVIRDSYASKPPTLSTYYSLPGRYLVLMPGADAAGISRKIEDEDQRGRLRRILDDLTIPEGFGVIVRTAGMETSIHELQTDLEALLELWRNIEKASAQAKAPALVYQERDLVIRTIRDYFTSDIEEVLIDDETTHRRARKFFEAHMPGSVEVVRLYTGDKPIFSKYNLEEQIERIFKRVVQLKSGGAISIDQTVALTAIDVNSARSTRSASSEDTALRTNLEAAEEIARQLRLRDIGGLIVIDFIDMETSKHIRQVERAFSEAMSRDKARYDVTRISKLGLLEVSRQRLKSAKATSSFMECPGCSGDGVVRTPEAAARSAFRKIHSRVVRGDLSEVKVYLAPEVAIYLLNDKRDDLFHLESRHHLHIAVVPEERMKSHEFEIAEIRREEIEIAPIVTAEEVDQAMADGTLVPPPPRPPEASLPATTIVEASPAKRKRGRRRRRHGRGQGAEDGAARPEDRPEAEHAASAALSDPDAPVFSEGPEGEDGPAWPAADFGAPAPDARERETRSGNGEAPAPAGRAGQQPGQRPPRRRRRRRGRGGAGQPRPGATSQDSRPRGGSPQVVLHDEGRPPLPRVASSEQAPAYMGSGGSRDKAPAQPPAESAASGDAEDKKPKRRWWRRALRG